MPKPFVELDPDIARRAVEGYENVLLGEQKKLDAFYRQFTCPACKGPVRKETTPQHAFGDPDVLVPRSFLHCADPDCDHIFDPHSGLTLQVGKMMPVPGVKK